jgi:hypothetical protein
MHPAIPNHPLIFARAGFSLLDFLKTGNEVKEMRDSEAETGART